MTLIYEQAKDQHLSNQNLLHYFIYLKTPYDNIWWETIKIPKINRKTLTASDSVQVERQMLELVREQYSYDIDQKKYDLAVKRFQENVTRAQNQLNIQKTTAITGAVTNVLTGSFVSGAIGRGFDALAAERESNKNMVGGALIKEGASNIASKGLGKGFSSGAITGFIGGLTKAGVNLAMDFSMRFPEEERKINVDKKLNSEALAIQSLMLNTSHMERQLNAQLALNQLNNIYDSPDITDGNLFDQFKKNKT